MDIILRNVRLFGYHGVNEGEEVVGGEYEVDVRVGIVEREISDIKDTLDYTGVYSIVNSRMGQRSGLLETIVQDIAGEIFAKYAMADEVEISLFKLHPPLKGFRGNVGVHYLKRRDR